MVFVRSGGSVSGLLVEVRQPSERAWISLYYYLLRSTAVQELRT